MAVHVRGFAVMSLSSHAASASQSVSSQLLSSA
jgi:hypothetical protein